ncbi:hypothetical protein GCM10010304_76460 [Streptomyces roseoviolaceus]
MEAVPPDSDRPVPVIPEDRTPEYWNNLYKNGDGLFREVSPFEREMLRAYVAPDSGWRAIDVGCGTGALTARLATWGMDVTGYDLSEVAVTEALAHHGARARFVVHDFTAHAIPQDLRPGTLDLAVCRLSLEYLDRARFLTDVRRWLKPEGVLHVTTYVAEKTSKVIRSGGLPDRVVQDLGCGFRTMTRYELEQDGSVTCVVLRGPQ